MMREEWLALTKTDDITPEDWEAVNTVYAWHPAILEAKEAARLKMLNLWKTCGYGIIQDMLPVAQTACDHDTEIARADIRWAATKKRYDELAKALQARKTKELEDINTQRRYHEVQVKSLKARYRQI